jgi:hypothetical protein
MPIQLSSEQRTLAVLLFLTDLFEVNSFPQCGQNLAHNGAGFWHLSQVSLGIGAPQSEQVRSIETLFSVKKLK